MSKNYEFEIDAHPSIYNGASRKLNIFFSEPEKGINPETGLVLFIPGFGGNARSKVYKKMRNNMADDYNLVTIQCDYFGQEFMQAAESISAAFTLDDLKQVFSQAELQRIYAGGTLQFNEFLKAGANYEIKVPVKAVLEESLSNFNDMGIMQAIDNITAVLAVIAILKDNGYSFNEKKIIAYGHSHGAYLSYLCNAFSPGLFSLIIDNSAWISPVYLTGSRHLYMEAGKMTLVVEFNYLASRLPYDKELLSLSSLYKEADSQCSIVSFHGTDDALVDSQVKQAFCKSISHCEFNLITPEDVDGTVFKSSGHGLDADFLKLFDYVMADRVFLSAGKIELRNHEIVTSTKRYQFNFDTGLLAVAIKEH